MRPTINDHQVHHSAATGGRLARISAVALMLAGLAMLASCGDDDDDRSAVATPTTAVASADSTTSAPATGSTTALIPPTTMVPGDISETVAAQPVEIAPPASLDDSVAGDSGVIASIADVRHVDVEAQLPGEISGPGVALTVALENGRDDALDLSGVVVDLVDAAGASATPINTGTEPFGGAVAAAQTATATYVFQIDEALQDDVTVRISYSADEPIVVFTGSLA